MCDSAHPPCARHTCCHTSSEGGLMGQLEGESLGWPICPVCHLRMHPANAADGFRTHPACDTPQRANGYGRRTGGYAIPQPY
ncbi:hypothetical protein SEA_ONEIAGILLIAN_71 [Microbacterium phage OneinaGillian]|uniref:Uncharacterized protein n=1 Tax=Microbacterium phage OneinaGillian TaxID=2301604 RepID=A0A385UF11_9CAUD|nr:hypothetical protein HOU23_gp071 [Microbacterium phage OneinaGillian]AYB70181.2 hypothetical protein SEA_ONEIAGILLIAN_71 [Microbacterium phage OneinaGillian]